MPPAAPQLLQAYGDRLLQKERQPSRGYLDGHPGVKVAPSPDNYTVVVRRVFEHGIGRRIHPRLGMTGPGHCEPPPGALGVRVGDGPDTNARVDSLHRGDHRGSPVSEPDNSEPRHASWIKHHPLLILRRPSGRSSSLNYCPAGLKVPSMSIMTVKLSS